MADMLWCAIRTWWCKRRGHHRPEDNFPGSDVLQCPNCYEVSLAAPTTGTTVPNEGTDD